MLLQQVNNLTIQQAESNMNLPRFPLLLLLAKGGFMSVAFRVNAFYLPRVEVLDRL